jgi:hypothetical protein
MPTTYRSLTVGLLALVLTAGCYTIECEITCADGFKIDVADECESSLTVQLAVDHGGICVSEEHTNYWP